MRRNTLLRFTAGTLLWYSFPFLNVGSVHALPIHTNNGATDTAVFNSHCQVAHFSDFEQDINHRCFSKRDSLIARAPRFMMMPKPKPKPKTKPKTPSGPGAGPEAPGSGTPGPLIPGKSQNQAPSNSPEMLTGDPVPNPPKNAAPGSGAPNQAPSSPPERLTGDPPPNPSKDPASDPQNPPKDPESNPDNPSPKPEDDPGQKPKDDRKDDELTEPMLMEPTPPGQTTTGPGSADPSQPEPLTGDPGSSSGNSQEKSDAEVSKQTEGVWKVDNGADALVTPKQTTDTMDATARLKSIRQEGTWWSSSGADVENSISSNPETMQSINDAITQHKSSSDPTAQLQRRQSAQNTTQSLNQMPSSMRDIIPGDAQKYWQSISGNGTQMDTADRMSYAYATWIKGDDFYVLTTPEADISTFGTFNSFELPYITTPRESTGEKDPFQAVYRVNVQEDGTVEVDPEPIWITGEAPAGSPVTRDWMSEGQTKSDPEEDV